MLIEMTVNAERSPGISGDKEISEPDLSFYLVFKPNPEISEFNFRFLFHKVRKVLQIPHRDIAHHRHQNHLSYHIPTLVSDMVTLIPMNFHILL